MGLLQPYLAIEKCGHRPWIDGWFSRHQPMLRDPWKNMKHMKTIYQHISYISYIHPFLQVHSKLCSFHFCACLMVEKTSGLSGLAIPHPTTGTCEVSWICWCTWSAHKFEMVWQDGPALWGWGSVLWYRSIRRLQKYTCRSLGNILPRYGKPSDRFPVPLIHRQWRWTKCCEGEQTGDGCEWVFSFSLFLSLSLSVFKQNKSSFGAILRGLFDRWLIFLRLEQVVLMSRSYS